MRDKIKIVSPSANIVDEKDLSILIENAEKLLSKNGYLFEYSKNSKSKNGFLSAKKEERAKDLMDAFKDNTVKAIIATQGGDNSNDLLNLLDYELIRENDKPFFGLSDITVLLNVIAVKSKIKTYHGIDVLWGLGKNSTEYSEKLINSILKDDLVILSKNKNTPKWSVINEGMNSGIILGGCLPSFCLLLGTKYDPINLLNEEYILILEDIGEDKALIKSKLVQIKQHTKFNLCRGIIFGNFAFSEQKPLENDVEIEVLAKEVFKEDNIPIARITEIGHCVENLILPIGGKAELKCNNLEVDLRLID